MAIPAFVAAGTAANTATGGGTSITPALPAGIAADNILVLVVETANEPVNKPAGWEFVGSGAVAQATGLITGLHIYWLRYTGSETAPTVTLTTGNHLVGRIAAFSGCHTSGSPVNGTPQVLADNGTTTAVAIPSGTTNVPDCLVLAAVSTGTDVASTAHISGWTNASLVSVTERMDNWSTTGNGGGFGLATGGLVSAGAFNQTTATLVTGNTKAAMSFALMPPQISPTGDPFSYVPGMRGNGPFY